MGSYQKATQKGIAKLQYFFRGSFVLFLFQLTITVSTKDSVTVVPLPKVESIDDCIDKAKSQLKTDKLEKRIEEFKKRRK